MEINVVENPMSRLSEAFYRHPTITELEQVEAAEKMSQELLHPTIETMPGGVEAVGRGETVIKMSSTALQMPRLNQLEICEAWVSATFSKHCPRPSIQPTPSVELHFSTRPP
jgi:hypothetical protein